MSHFSQASIPSEPTPKLVHVTNIAASASEEKVREFFLFCGKIQAFQLVKAEGSDTQEALISFDKESAAKTATMLSNAVIADQQINVKYYFSDTYGSNVEHDHAAAADAKNATAGTQEEKPKTGIVTEVLAAGYQVSDHIIDRATTFDAQYGVSTRMQSYYQQALEKLGQLDEKYQIRKTVTAKAGELDAKYAVSDKVGAAAASVQAAAASALQTGPGQKAAGILTQAKTQVGTQLEASRAVAQEKKAAAAPGVAGQQ